MLGSLWILFTIRVVGVIAVDGNSSEAVCMRDFLVGGVLCDSKSLAWKNIQEFVCIVVLMS